MRLRSLLATAALAAVAGIGSLAMMATPASASVVNPAPPQSWNWQGDHGMCPQDRNWNNDNRNCRCQDTWIRDSRTVLPWENSCVCRPVVITFDFAPSVGAPEGTWLLETGGPALHDNELLTYHGATWRVEDWQPFGNGSLGNHKPYFILMRGSFTLSGSLRDNPQTAWLTQEICTTSFNPCPRGDLRTTTDSSWSWGSQSSCVPCKPVTPPCKPVIRDPKPCKTGSDSSWNNDHQGSRGWNSGPLHII